MAAERKPPLIVLEPDPGELRDVIDELHGAGWRIHEGWAFARRSWGIESAGVVCVGAVRDSPDAEAAVLAAARGAGIVAEVSCTKDVTERLFQDLRRLGEVELRGPHGAEPPSRLDAEQARLLELLATGATLEEAAGELGYSRRTVNRRLAAIRERLGVGTTAEALAAIRNAQPRR